MNEITIPFHLAIPAIIAFVGLAFILLKRKRIVQSNRKWLLISLGLFCGLYVLIVGGAAIDSIYIQWNANQYDLNKDGLFGSDEITDEQQAATSRLSNDTGRNFSFIIGFIFSAFVSVVFFILASITEKFKKSSFKIFSKTKNLLPISQKKVFKNASINEKTLSHNLVDF